MPKKILLIESDAEFAREMANALEQKGFETRTTGDGKEGLDLARDEHPDAIILCVELPKMSGYSICAKLKKDDTLKSIPVVIISTEATPETFDQHKQLKTRAEDYLLKPFDPAELVKRLGDLIGLPPEPPPTEEEVVTLADVELEALVEPDGVLLDLTPTAGALPEDEDLRLLDTAFENIATPAPSSEAEAEAELSFGDKLPEVPTEAAAAPPDDEAAATPAGAADADEDAALLAALGPLEQDEQLIPSPEEEGLPGVGSVREVEPEIGELPPFDQAEATQLSQSLAATEEELESVRREMTQRDTELQHLREHVQDLEGRVVRGAADLARAETDLRARDAELGSFKSRFESQSSSMKKLETDLRTGREETQRVGERALKAERELARSREHAEKSAQELAQSHEHAEKIEQELAQSREHAERIEQELAQSREHAEKIEQELAHLREHAQQTEQELSQSREHVERTEKELSQLCERTELTDRDLAYMRERAEEAERAVGQKAAEMAEALGKLEASEQELDGLRDDLAAAQNEAAAAREDFEKQAAELQKRLLELEALTSKNEERVVRAYQKIKSDEKLREKTRKALTIALQLLDEHGPVTDPEKRPAARE